MTEEMEKTKAKRLYLGLNLTNPAITLTVKNRKKIIPFVDALWTIVLYTNAQGESVYAAFSTKYRSEPNLIGAHKDIILNFSFGDDRKFSVSVDGETLSPDRIRRLSFFANTDMGTALVSFYPGMIEDAQPFIAFFSRKKEMRIIARHMAASWLHELWGLKDE